MNLPEEDLVIKIKQIESDIAYAKEVLQKSEKYERLIRDPDFKDFLKDFEEGFQIHGDQVNQSLAMLTDSSPRQQEDLFRIILIHQSKREAVKALTERPMQIVKLADEKRKQLPILEKELETIRGEL